jgi:hypothetical protein
MRSLFLATATLAATFALGSTAAHADETLAVTAPAATPPESRFSLQAFGTMLVVDEGAFLGGLEADVRLSHSFVLALDYAPLEPTEGFGLLGANLHWLATDGNIATYLYAGAAAAFDGLEPIDDLAVFRGGVGGEYTAPNGMFVSAELGVDMVAVDDLVIPLAEARLGIGVRF